MSNNHPLFPPTGNNNNNNNNKKKRKNRTYLPVGDYTSRQNKQRKASQPANTPIIAPPAQPGFGFGNSQMANPTIYGPHNPTPFTPMGSASLVPQYSQFQAQFQPQAQYLQQPPQHVPQPGAYQPISNMQPTSGFASLGFAAGQQPMTPWAAVNAQHPESSVQSGKKRVGLVHAEDLEAHGSGAIPTKLTVKGRSDKDDFVPQIIDPNVTVSTSSGPEAREVIDSQLAWHQNMYGEHNQIITATKTVPILATGSRALNRNIESTDSTENLISTKTGGRRQKPGKPQAQAQLPTPAQAQAHPQGQPTLPCANCSREGHLVGDCVGPPNQVHGDLPACPICDSFAGRVKDNAGPSVHRFDDCHKVLAVLYRLRKEKYHRLDYKDLASLTNDELLMFFRALVVKRVRKVPIRTKLVCWIDVLREAARRFQNTETITSLGKMTPWTKAYAIQQHKLGALQVKPWEFYDYEAGNTQSLPAGPVEQVETNWEDFVANGLPQFAAQVFVSSDRQQPPRTDTVPSGSGVPASRSYGNDVGQSWTPAVFSGSPRQFGAAATEVSHGQRTLFSAPSSSGPVQPPTLNATLSSRRSPAQMDAGVISASASLPSAPTSASDTSHVVEPNSEGVSNELASPARFTRGPITVLNFGEILNRGQMIAGPSTQASDAHRRLMKKVPGRPPQARPTQIPDT